MALTSIGGLVPLPGAIPTSIVTILIDDANEYSAGIFRALSTTPITNLGFATVNATTPQALRCGIMGVDAATGLPDIAGGWLGAGAAGYFDVASPAANTVYSGDLGASVTPVIGTSYAIVVKLVNDATLPVSVQIANAYNWMPAMAKDSGVALLISNTVYSVGPTAKATTLCPMFNISRSGVYIPEFVAPILTTGWGAVSLDADGAIRESGNRFRLPFGARAVGAVYHSDADYDTEVHLYSDAGSSLASGTHDKDIRALTAVATGFVPFTAPYTLVADTWYRLAVKATSTTAGNLAYKVIFSSAASLAQLDLGVNCYYTSKDSSTWTDATAQRGMISIVIDQIDAAGAAGGRPEFRGGNL